MIWLLTIVESSIIPIWKFIKVMKVINVIVIIKVLVSKLFKVFLNYIVAICCLHAVRSFQKKRDSGTGVYCEFCEISKNTFLKNISGRLLLNNCWKMCNMRGRNWECKSAYLYCNFKCNLCNNKILFLVIPLK